MTSLWEQPIFLFKRHMTVRWRRIKEKRNNNEFKKVPNKEVKLTSLLPWFPGTIRYRKSIFMRLLRRMILKIKFCMCRLIPKTLRWMKILQTCLHSLSIQKRESQILYRMSQFLFRKRKMIILIKCSKMFRSQIFPVYLIFEKQRKQN